MGRPNTAFIRLNNSPYRNEYIDMRKRGIPVTQIHQYYLQKEGKMDEETGSKPVSYHTFKRWLDSQVPLPISDSSTITDLTLMAIEVIERDRTILSQLDENLELLKALSTSLSRMTQEQPSTQVARAIVEVIREIRQTIQTIIELRDKLKSVGMVSPRIVRDALVEAMAKIPPSERKIVLKEFDSVIQRVVSLNVSRATGTSIVGDDNTTEPS